jgi:hypothetical protein
MVQHPDDEKLNITSIRKCLTENNQKYAQLGQETKNYCKPKERGKQTGALTDR